MAPARGDIAGSPGNHVVNCPTCATELPTGARFCGKCGHRLVSSAPPPAVNSRANLPPVAGHAAPPEDAAAEFGDIPTRADPATMRKALKQARHPTGILTGASQAAIEAELRRAAAEFENADATRVDEGLSAPPDASGFEAPTQMVDPDVVRNLAASTSGPRPPVTTPAPAPRAAPAASTSGARAPVASPPPSPAAPDALAQMMEDASGFSSGRTGAMPVDLVDEAMQRARPGGDLGGPDATPATAEPFPWMLLVGVALGVIVVGGSVAYLVAGR